MPQGKCLRKGISPFLRPQSAVGSFKHSADDSTEFVVSQKEQPKTLRPWSAHPRQRMELSDKKVMRQNLRKPHLKAKGRHQEASGMKALEVLRSDTSVLTDSSVRSQEIELDVVTMVGVETRKSPTFPGQVLSASTQTTRSTVSQTEMVEEEAIEKRLSPKKRHPSFDTWVAGSPHDSDEYDTDLEEKEAKLGKKPTTPPKRPSDASGAGFYEDICRKHGFVPISFLRRHLGKRNIRMRHHYLGGRAARPLAAAFQHNTITETLDLSDNYLEATGAASLAMMLRDNTFITMLNLSNNFIESYGCRAMAEMLDHNTTLKSLSLAGNRLKDMDAHYFIEPLKNNLSLTCLDLSHNEFGEMGGLHLGAAISVNDGVTELDLSWNAIRRKGAAAIANALKINTFLEVLDLAWNGLGEEGTLAMAQALQVNTYLKVLDLTNNRIDKQSAVKLANGLKKNYGLETLILNLNPLGDQGIEAILKAADVHPCLRFLSMEEMGLNPENLQHIHELERDKDMIILYGGSGGYQRNTSLQSVLRLFGRFSRQHMPDLETAFFSQDKDRSGVLTAEETKMCLRTAGLRLTGKQLDLMIDEIDFSHSGNIRYREILSGEVFREYHLRRPSRGFSLEEVASVTLLDVEEET